MSAALTVILSVRTTFHGSSSATSLLGHLAVRSGYVMKVGFRIDTIQPARPDRPYSRVPRSPPWSPLPEEDKILFPKTQTARSGLVPAALLSGSLPCHLHSSSTAHPTGSGHKRTLLPRRDFFRQRGSFFHWPVAQRCQQRFCFGIVRVARRSSVREAAYFFLSRTAHRIRFRASRCRCVSAYIDIMGFFGGHGPNMRLLSAALLHVPD